MSVRSMARVWELSRHAGSQLLMLLAIADFSDDDGRAYPAVATLARKCRMQPRNANVILKALKESGELQVRLGQGPKGTNLYRILLPAEGMQERAGVQERAGAQGLAVSPAMPCTTPCNGLPETPARECSQTISEPPKNHHEPKGKRAKSAAAPAVPRPGHVPDRVWTDWLALRKAKRAPVTLTVLEHAQSEAAKAGMTLEAFLREWVGRGSQGLQADWLPNRAGTATKRPVGQLLDGMDYTARVGNE